MTAMISDSSSLARGKGKWPARSADGHIDGEIVDVPRARRVFVVTFLIHQSPGLLDRQTADAAVIPRTAGWPAPGHRPIPLRRRPAHHREVLTYGETRVLHYLPTNLSAREIADELYISVNTVKTHQRHLYQKLGARSRTQAVGRARDLGLLAPSSHGPHQ